MKSGFVSPIGRWSQSKYSQLSKNMFHHSINLIKIGWSWVFFFYYHYFFLYIHISSFLLNPFVGRLSFVSMGVINVASYSGLKCCEQWNHHQQLDAWMQASVNFRWRMQNRWNSANHRSESRTGTPCTASKPIIHSNSKILISLLRFWNSNVHRIT